MIVPFGYLPRIVYQFTCCTRDAIDALGDVVVEPEDEPPELLEPDEADPLSAASVLEPAMPSAL